MKKELYDSKICMLGSLILFIAGYIILIVRLLDTKEFKFSLSNAGISDASRWSTTMAATIFFMNKI